MQTQVDTGGVARSRRILCGECTPPFLHSTSGGHQGRLLTSTAQLTGVSANCTQLACPALLCLRPPFAVIDAVMDAVMRALGSTAVLLLNRAVKGQLEGRGCGRSTAQTERWTWMTHRRRHATACCSSRQLLSGACVFCPTDTYSYAGMTDATLNCQTKLIARGQSGGHSGGRRIIVSSHQECQHE